MTHTSIFPPRAQLDVSNYATNAQFGKTGTVLVAAAKKFIMEPAGGGQKLSFNCPEAGKHIKMMKGAGRVVTDILYTLVLMAPTRDLSEAVTWADLTFPDVIPTWDVDLGNGKTGPLEQGAAWLAREYFAASMAWAYESGALDDAEQARKAKSQANNAAARAKWEANQAKRKAAKAKSIAKSTARNAEARKKFYANRAHEPASKQTSKPTRQTAKDSNKPVTALVRAMQDAKEASLV